MTPPALPRTSADAGTGRRDLLRSARNLGFGALLAGSGASLLAGCSSDSGHKSTAAASVGGTKRSTVRWQFNWVPDVEWGSWYVADSTGLFAKQHVPVRLIHGGPNTPSVTQLVAAGQADIGVSSDELEILHANAKGGDFVVIGAMYQRSPFGYTWLTKSGISSPADLVGKRIGGAQGDQIRIEAVFKVNKLPVHYTFVPMSYDPHPLVKGEMDAITSYTTNQPIQLRQEGVDVTAVTFSDFGLKSYGDVLFASRKYLDAHHDDVVAALAGLLAGTEANVADPSVAVGLTVDKYGKDNKLSRKFEVAANTGFIELLSSDYTKANGLLSVDPDYMGGKIFAGYRAAGEKNLPPIAKFVDHSYMAAAHALRAKG